MFAALARQILAHRLLTALLLGALVAVTGAGVTRLEVHLDARNFFATADPELERLDQHIAFWGKDDNQLLVLASADSGALLTRPRLYRLRQLGRSLDSLEAVIAVASLAEMPTVRMRGGGLMRDVESVVESVPPTDSRQYRGWVWQLTHASPYVPLLLSEDAQVSALLITLDPDLGDTETIGVVQGIQARVADFDGPLGLRFRLAGVPAMRASIFALLVGDQLFFVPLGLGFILVVLALLFRRPHGVLTPFLTAAVPLVMLAGMMGWTGQPIGILNQIYFTLLPVITVADAIHLVTRYHEELRKRGKARPDRSQRHDAIVEALRHIGPACGLTAFTTIVGFLSLNVASMPNLRNFGNYAALGMCFAYLNTLCLAPLLLSLARSSPPAGDDPGRPTPIERLLAACARLSLGRPRTVLGITLLAVLAWGSYGFDVIVDSDLISMIERKHPVWRANQVLAEKLGGLLDLDVDLRTAPGGFEDPALLARVSSLERWARSQPIVRSSQSPASLLEGMNQLSSGRAFLPRTERAVASGFARLRALGQLDGVLTADAGRARIVLRTQDRGAVAFQAFVAELEARIGETFGPEVESYVTGTALVGYRGVSHLTVDLRNSLVLVFLSVALVIGLLFRSLRVALLCFVPNALPLVVGYGLLGFMGWWLQPAPAVMFTVALAIAVDDTIHLMARVREELRRGQSLLTAVRQAIMHCGRAVVTTSVLLVGGMSLSQLSAFPTMVVMSGLGMAVIAVAMLCDLFVLPALLVLFPVAPTAPESD